MKALESFSVVAAYKFKPRANTDELLRKKSKKRVYINSLNPQVTRVRGGIMILSNL